MKYDPSIHHRRSIRLPDYDYSQAGVYFVTICTYEKESLFGEIRDRRMELTNYGRLVELEWQRLEQRFSRIKNGEFSIMPNHLHGILNILRQFQVGARQERERQTKNQLFASPLQANLSLGVVLGSFKSTTTRLINGLRHTPGRPVWQRNYYEHVIRDDADYERIAEYIQNNTLNWEMDDLFLIE